MHQHYRDSNGAKYCDIDSDQLSRYIAISILSLSPNHVASRHVCMYTCIQVIINILAPIEIRHSVKSLELNNGQLQCFVECPVRETTNGSVPDAGKN